MASILGLVLRRLFALARVDQKRARPLVNRLREQVPAGPQIRLGNRSALFLRSDTDRLKRANLAGANRIQAEVLAVLRGTAEQPMDARDRRGIGGSQRAAHGQPVLLPELAIALLD